jgi:hypothetical protein
MKNLPLVFAATILATTAIALATSAPAQQVDPSAIGPVAKTKRAPASRGDVTRIPGGLAKDRMGTIPIVLNAPTEACVYQDAFYAGPSFCSKQLAYQELPQSLRGKVSGVSAPDGYQVILYSGTGPSAITCRYIGLHAGLDGGCDDFATGMAIVPHRGRAVALLAEDEQRRGAVRTGDQEEVNRIYADNQRRAEERARTEGPEASRRARAAREAAEKARQVGLMGSCPVELYSTDGPNPDKRCLTMDLQLAYVGDDWNDDIERVIVKTPYAMLVGYEHANFQGRRVTIMCGDWELIGDPENEISSLRVEYVSLGDEIYCGDQQRELTKWGY